MEFRKVFERSTQTGKFIADQHGQIPIYLNKNEEVEILHIKYC